MSRSTIVTKEPVVLDGFQAVMKPSQYGHTLSAIVDQEIIDKLEAERPALLDYGKNKLKAPSRGRANPEPWEEVSEGKYRVKFTWKEDAKKKPVVVDTEGTILTDENLPIFGGATVKLAFHQYGYGLSNIYGTKLDLTHVQVVSLNAPAGMDTGSMGPEDAVALFGKTEGFVAASPAVTPNTPDEVDF